MAWGYLTWTKRRWLCACHAVHTKLTWAIGIVTWRAVKGMPMIGLEPSVTHGQQLGNGHWAHRWVEKLSRSKSGTPLRQHGRYLVPMRLCCSPVAYEGPSPARPVCVCELGRPLCIFFLSLWPAALLSQLYLASVHGCLFFRDGAMLR
jgi:hypothetical protein